MSIGFGHRARVGHIYPSGGLCDYEIQLMAPEGVQFLTTRLPFRRTGLADDRAMADGVAEAASLLADADVELIAFNCTAASMLVGSDVIRERVRVASGGLACVSTIDAVLAAIDVLEARRIVLLTPYPAEVEDAEVAFLAERGIAVIRRAGPACGTPVEQGAIAAEEWVRLATEQDVSDVDLILISCAGTQTAAAIAPIERLTGLPVVTSNQALLWLVLARCGITDPLPAYGRLLGHRLAARRSEFRRG